MNTQTTYMGLKVSSPIIAGSCGLTANLDKLKAMEDAGAGAVVLKSLFEEQIQHEMHTHSRVVHDYSEHPDAYNYIKESTHTALVGEYLDLIAKAKATLHIPVVASVNCVTASDWLSYTKKMQSAGADAVELNAFILPANSSQTEEDIYAFYEDLIQIIKRAISIPFGLKVSSYFTSLARTLQKYSWMGVSGLTLFNKFYLPDIDITTERVSSANFTAPSTEFYNTLRWIAILSNQVRCDISGTTGVKNGEDVIKFLLAGASSAQVVSAMYRDGIGVVKTMNETLQKWMREHHYETIQDFKGKLAHNHTEDTTGFYRIQFMKYYSQVNNR